MIFVGAGIGPVWLVGVPVGGLAGFDSSASTSGVLQMPSVQPQTISLGRLAMQRTIDTLTAHSSDGSVMTIAGRDVAIEVNKHYSVEMVRCEDWDGDYWHNADKTLWVRVK